MLTLKPGNHSELTLKPGNLGEWSDEKGNAPNANIDFPAFSGKAQLFQFTNAVKCAGISQSLRLRGRPKIQNHKQQFGILDVGQPLGVNNCCWQAWLKWQITIFMNLKYGILRNDLKSARNGLYPPR